MLECFRGGLRGVTAIVDPSHVDHITGIGFDHCDVQHDVGEAGSRLRVSLDDVFEAFDDADPAEFDVALGNARPS